MSTTCSLSETSSGCSCAAPAGFYPLRLRARAADTFPFAAQPFVYYAGVPEIGSERQTSREKGDKPNCFVKAFRWYTQEHGAIKTTGEQRTVAGAKNVEFASWLDSKYQQYLRDNQTTNADGFKSGAGNVPSPTANQDAATHKSAKPKGFQRVLRSPWRKRRAAAKSPERGTCTECKSSWQILLRPKSLSHLESETCAKKRSTTCGASSRVTLTSSDTHIIVRTFSKRVELVVHEIIDSDIENKETTMKIDGLSSQNTYTLENNSAEVKNLKTKVVCECPVGTDEGGANTTDTATQYDPTINVAVKPPDNVTTIEVTSKLDYSNTSCESERPGYIKKYPSATTDKDKHITIATGPDDELRSPCTCKGYTPVRCHHVYNNACNSYKQILRKHQESHQRPVCCAVCSAEDSAQTSDYAITPRPGNGNSWMSKILSDEVKLRPTRLTNPRIAIHFLKSGYLRYF